MNANAPQLLRYDMGARVVAFSTTRHGGEGTGLYAEFNVNRYCGDAEESIQANRRSLCRLLGIGERQLVYPHQTHGTEVRAIDERFMALADDERTRLLEGVDGVMTDVRQVCVGVSTADCIPVLLYDEAHHAVAAIHAGWRGTAKRIVERAVGQMQATYGTEPAALIAVIGPGISLDHFEVGDEVYAVFAEAGFAMQDIARKYEKWHIDLWECNQRQLTGMGVKAENISCAAICTFASCDDFFSARRLGVNSGRILTAIMVE